MQSRETQDRFKDAPWFPERDEYVIVGGAGGIGSWLTFFLSRAGFIPSVYDFDIIEAHNLGGQLFRQEDVGLLKTAALATLIYTYTGENINAFSERVDQHMMSHHFMFSAFDNMLARKHLFEAWKRSLPGAMIPPIFIDGRLEMEQLQIFCVTPATMDEYEREHLFDDSEVDDAPCTMRQTSHSAAMIATHMVASFTNHMTNVYERHVVRPVPFYYEHFIPLTLTTLE